MSAFLVAVAVVEVIVCVAVAVLLSRRWWRQRSTATSSAVGVFAVVAVVVASSVPEPADPTSGWGAVQQEVLICLLLAVPYLLARFTWALGGIGDATHRATAGLYAVEVLVTLAAPPLPPEGAPRSGWVLGYVAFVLVAWSVQSLVAAAGLWRAGRGTSSVVRQRMRSLALGAVLLAVTLVASGTSSDTAGGGEAAVIAILGLLSILLFALAFLLPASLRLVWRREDLAALALAERGLMTATSRQEVAETIVPTLAAVLGGGAALLDGRGVPVRTAGSDARGWTDLPLEPPGRGPVWSVRPGVLAADVQDGMLVVRAGRLAPVFGDDEAQLLGRVATLVGLALQRVRLFEQERASREAAEAASADLESLLYSVSHDLRSPLVSVLGYLDVLRAEHGDDLSGSGPHCLQRISVNALYMQHLISDLLELSRIGRSAGPVEQLDLSALAHDVLESARLHAPQASLAVNGPLPAVRMTGVRARQLLTNLVDNALQHGGRPDLTVTVSATAGPDGEVVLQVADDGVGIPAEYRDRVLRVFERLDTARPGPSTGMGLAICKRICESFGGALRVQGPPPGAATGTTVVVVLPARALTPAVPAPRGSTSAAVLPATAEVTA